MENLTDLSNYRGRPNCHLNLEQLILDENLQQWPQGNNSIVRLEPKRQYFQKASDEKICVADWRDDALEIFWV